MFLIEKIVKAVGKGVSWLTFLLVVVIVTDVFLRYTFNTTSAVSFELEWHLFALIFLLSAAWTLQEDRHVRVDVFYHRFSKKTRAWINLIGTLFLLIPFCSVAFWESLSFVENAYRIRETSPDPGGLPARYLIKAAIPTALLLLILQGMAIILRAIKTIRQ